jgi:beta-lactamase regulating signal transducer with metallopeptidase domain
MMDGWMMLDRAGRWLFPHFVNALWMSSVFVLFIWLIVQGGRVRAAVVQHALWRAALLGLCLSPLLACVGEALGLPTLGYLARTRVRPAAAPASAPAVAVPAVRPEWEADQQAVGPDRDAAVPPRAEGTASLPGDETRSRPLALHALARTHGLALLAALWWVGLTFTLARWEMHRIRLGRMNRATEAVGDPTLLAAVQRARERLGLRRPVAVRQSTDLSVPVVFGAWRPCLLLPSGWAGRADAETLEAVLLHELAHVARGDLGVNAWLQAAQCAFWFHPLVYLIGRELSRTAEAACDDWVIVETGQRTRYASVLVGLAERMVSRPAGTLAGLPFARRGSNLKRRVQMILDEKRPLAARLSRRAKWGLGIVTILAGALAMSTRAMGIAEEPSRVTEQSEYDGLETNNVLDRPLQKRAEAKPESRPEPRRKPLGHLGMDEEFLVFKQVDRERTVLLAQYLASGKTFKLLESEESADLDYVPSPDGDRLLIIEWNKGHPAWNYEYWARVVLLDLKSLVLRELVGPEEFPSLPMWIDNQRVAVLLDGRQGVTLNTETLERQKPVLLPAYPRDKGGSIEYDDGLQLVYVRRLGSGARLQRTAQLIKETDPLIGFLSFHGKDVYKISQVGAFGLPQCVIPPLLRSFGLPQFPSDWMLGSVPLQEPFMGEGLRRVRARKPELSLSPDGNFVAYSGLRDPAQGWEGGF